MQLTIAHLSDLHLAPVRGIGPRHFNLKRALGFANWMLKRRHVHRREAVDALLADLAAQPVDHVIVSGDLVNLGLPGEHAAALEWLKALGPPDRVSVVPGNHDIYCPLWRDPGIERWRAYMTSDAAGAALATSGEFGFPYVRVLGRLAIVGLNSAIPTRPFQAIGRIGERQLAAVAETLDRLRAEGLMRLVVVHHPPLVGQADARRGLIDADRLEAVLAEHGAELVLHGHYHVDMHATRAWRGGRTDVIGLASASVGRSYKHEPLGRYNLIRLEPSQPQSGIEIISRGLRSLDRPVVELGRRTLAAAPPTVAG